MSAVASARVAVCDHCRKPIVRPLSGPRAGLWLHTDGFEQCRDRWAHLMPVTATPARPWGSPTGPVRQAEQREHGNSGPGDPLERRSAELAGKTCSCGRPAVRMLPGPDGQPTVPYCGIPGGGR